MHRILAVFISAALIFSGGCKPIDKDSYDNQTSTDTELTEILTETVAELTMVISKYTESSTFKSETETSIDCDSEIVTLINKIRIENGIEPLILSSKLCRVAEIRAKEACELWSHTRPDGSKISNLADDYGVEWTIIGENLAKHKKASAKNVVEAWTKSETHYKNLMNPKFRVCGTGDYKYVSTIYISIIFIN